MKIEMSFRAGDMGFSTGDGGHVNQGWGVYDTETRMMLLTHRGLERDSRQPILPYGGRVAVVFPESASGKRSYTISLDAAAKLGFDVQALAKTADAKPAPPPPPKVREKEKSTLVPISLKAESQAKV